MARFVKWVTPCPTLSFCVLREFSCFLMFGRLFSASSWMPSRRTSGLLPAAVPLRGKIFEKVSNGWYRTRKIGFSFFESRIFPQPLKIKMHRGYEESFDLDADRAINSKTSVRREVTDRLAFCFCFFCFFFSNWSVELDMCIHISRRP